MANADFKKVVSELLDEGDGKRAATGKRAASSTDALPTIDQRVDLYLRAVHGGEAATEAQRSAARARILDSMAADLAGESLQEAPSAATPAVSVRAVRQHPSAFSEALRRAAEALRDGLLFPLMGTSLAGQPARVFALSCAAILVIGGGWTATWFYAARSAETAVAAWIDSEAEAGRNYSCGSRKVGGFPTRVEISCTGFQATVAASEQSTLTVNATSVRAVASLLSPSTLTTDITGPVTVAQSQQAASYVGKFKVAQLTLTGPAANPQQVSLVLDDPEFYRVMRGSQEALLAGGRLELDAKAAEDANGRVYNIAAQARDMSLPNGGLITSRPFVADVSAVLRDSGASASNLAARLRDWQRAGGRLDIAKAQLEQGGAVATGSGQIALNDNGQLQGALQVSTGGAYAQLAQSFLRDGQGGARERERVAQAYLGTPRINRSLGGPQTEKELAARRPAAQPKPQPQPQPPQGKYEIPIRFDNGTVYFGTTPLAEMPALF
jgi:hypothetical protein